MYRFKVLTDGDAGNDGSTLADASAADATLAKDSLLDASPLDGPQTLDDDPAAGA